MTASTLSQPGASWTPVASTGPNVEPDRQLVLYGLLNGHKVVRAESGYRSGVIRGHFWATHWMHLPAVAACFDPAPSFYAA